MKTKKETNCRLGKTGGQAVLEGVMMRSESTVAIAVRRLDNKKIVARVKPTKTIKDKVKFFRIPIIRGIVNFIEMLILSFSTMTASTEMLGLEEEEPSKFEKWLERKFGSSLMSVISVLSVVLGVALAMLLFFYLPIGSTNLIQSITGWERGWWKVLVEGLMKFVIFLCYLLLVSLIPDIKRVFQYHGAEHKAIFCYERNEELTVENVRKQSRFHPRCGTSFMFLMLIISIVISSVLPLDSFEQPFVRFCLKLPLIFPIVGIGYEILRFSGKHNNLFIRILVAPGLWFQRITTKEPDDGMIEVAVVALKASLPNEFPDFVAPLEGREEPEEAKNQASGAQEAADTTTEAKENDVKEESTVHENS